MTFRLPAKLSRRIRRIAAKAGVKQSEILRRAAEAYVDISDSVLPGRPIDRARTLIGSVHTGIPDLAVRHSEYLKEILKRGR